MLSGTSRGPVADSVNDEQDVVDGRIGHPEYVLLGGDLSAMCRGHIADNVRTMRTCPRHYANYYFCPRCI